MLNISSFIYWPFDFFRELCFQHICPFINWITCSIVFTFWSSLYILDINALLDKFLIGRINLEGNTHAQEINVSQFPV
jgi:hypothetical protein